MSQLSDTFRLRRCQVDPTFTEAWEEVRPPGTGGAECWGCAASNADGSILLAGIGDARFSGTAGRLYISYNSGTSWTEIQPAGDADKQWGAAAIDADGSNMIVAAHAGRVYLSTDYGVTWAETQPAGDANGEWSSAMSDSDGSVLGVGAGTGYFYLSVNSGASWTIKPNASWSGYCYGCACDSDGSSIIISFSGGRLLTSADSGGSWTERKPAGDADQSWTNAAIDSDGTNMIVGERGGRLWTSSNSGVDWTERRPTGISEDLNWECVTSNSDGSILYAAVHSSSTKGRVFVSIDSGVTWTEIQPAGDDDFYWDCMASDADSSNMILGIGDGAGPGGLYIAKIGWSKRLMPVVYGDITDGLMATEGNWEIPCLNKATFTYVFAGHKVISVANGNEIDIYVDGVLEAPANYTFDHSDDPDGTGSLASIVFDSDQGNKKITVRGKGSRDPDDIAILLTNPIDIIEDFLTVKGDFTSALFEPTAKAKAHQVCDAQQYKIAGVITDDGTYWDIVTEMMASFLGSAYLNGAGLLVLEIDDGTINSAGATIISKADISLTDAILRISNVINQFPSQYRYSYVSGDFQKETNDANFMDLFSQGVYGVRIPDEPYEFLWCRDLISVNMMQTIVVAKLKDPTYEIEFKDLSLKHLHLDVGDIIALTIDSLYDIVGSPLYNQFWKIVSVSPNFKEGYITFRALQTSSYMQIGGVRDTTIY